MKDIVIHTFVVPEALTIILESCVYHKLLRSQVKFTFCCKETLSGKNNWSESC